MERVEPRSWIVCAIVRVCLSSSEVDGQATKVKALRSCLSSSRLWILHGCVTTAFLDQSKRLMKSATEEEEGMRESSGRGRVELH